MEEQFVPTTCWSDVSSDLRIMDYSIQPLDPEAQLMGPAYTVDLPVGDNLDLIQAILEAPKGSVLVVNSNDNQKTAVIGDLYCAAAKELGIKGIVIDGLVRDYQEINELDFPVFAKGHCVKGPQKRGGGQKGVEVECGGIRIKPADMIIADGNGVVAISASDYDRYFELASEKNHSDEMKGEKIADNPAYAREFLDRLVIKYSK